LKIQFCFLSEYIKILDSPCARIVIRSV